MKARLTGPVSFAITILVAAGCVSHRKDYTRGETDICEIHHQKMQKVMVPAHYGLMSVTQRGAAMYSASTNTFPHAEDSVNPGCDPRGPREALIYNCSECVKVRHQWEADYDAKH
jgi:hypothetical protein